MQPSDVNSAEPNSYGVALTKSGDVWRVSILDFAGQPVSDRSFSSEDEAGTFASTVRQHIDWLSEERFRDYYRIEG